MKAALVSSFFGTERRGGATAAAQVLADGLTQQGIQLVVIATHARHQMTAEHMGGVKVYRFFPWNLYWVGDKNRQPAWKKVPWQVLDIWNLHAFWVVRRILRQERPDIVHVNKLRGLSPSVWAAASAVGGIPVVQTCHDYELMSPEGTLNSRIGFWAQEETWFLRPYWEMRAWFSRTVVAATAPSQYALEQLTGRGFFPRAVKQVIPNSHGLTLEQLQRQEEQMRTHARSEDGVVRMLYLGRLETTKGVDLLCEAFKRCAVQAPNAHLDIAGWGTLEDHLRRRYGNNRQITFRGPVFGEDKSRLLADSDLLVAPSVWPEVFGIVVVEAYAHGKPVVATRIGGILELVREGETGFLVSPGDVDALAEVLSRIAKVPGMLAAMAPRCFAAARCYAREQVVGAYVSLYETVLKQAAH